MGKLTLSQAQKQASSLGMTIKRDAEWGEYVVYPKGSPGHDGKYHTDDLEDAMLSAKNMAKTMTPNISNDLKRRYDFFRSQGYGSQTAIRLARAEQAAEERGWECEWEHERDPDLSWADEKQLAEIQEVLTCVLKDEEGDVLDALGGVVDPGREYARVVEAEMAAGALMAQEGYSANREPACEIAAEELVLFIDNERDLAPFGPEGQGKAAADNLRRKMARGTYDPMLAPKQMMYVADAGAKRYTKEHGTPGPHGSFGIFNKATRELAAKKLARSFEAEMEAQGEYQPNQGDGYYIAQWILGDRVLYEHSYDDPDDAINEAKNEMDEPSFEGDQARVITLDGELVWSSAGDGYEANARQREPAEKLSFAARRFWVTMHSVAKRDPEESFPWERRGRNWSEVTVGMHPAVIDAAVRQGFAVKVRHEGDVRLTAKGRARAAEIVKALGY